jgi:DNA-binding phage protein
MATDDELRQRYSRLLPHFTERERRLLVAADALEEGRGGVSRVARASGCCRETIYQGIRELHATAPVLSSPGRVRQKGGGRKRCESLDPDLLLALTRLLDASTRGDPESALKWSSKSCAKLAAELTAAGHPISHNTVRRFLKAMAYRLQATRKVLEGGGHPDRDAQFRHIRDAAQARLAAGEPVISVDCKKKELIGRFANKGREYQPTGEPEQVNVYDYPSDAVGKAIPYGVYDIGANAGWVSVGMTHDTAAFAVATIRQWWEHQGAARYPQATRLLICADGGGSNGRRCRLWKRDLQGWADDTGLQISVCHFPPGTSKWNKIEHRLFGQISINWRGKPLISYEVAVELIGHTTTTTGLRVHATLDTEDYPIGIKVTDDEVAEFQLTQDTFHGEWNYTIKPHERPVS